MHHILERHRATAIEEMYRVLRPGGRLLLADAHPSPRFRAVVARVNPSSTGMLIATKPAE